MMRKVLQLGDPVLRQQSHRVNAVDKKTGQIIVDLRDTLIHFRKTRGYGRGIAAPQIGELQNIIYVEVGDLNLALINPKITKKSSAFLELWDSCFSFDAQFFVKVKRHKMVTVEFMNDRGETKSVEAEGDLGELLQHEIDHLHGVLAVDRMIDTKHIIMREEYQKQYGAESL